MEPTYEISGEEIGDTTIMHNPHTTNVPWWEIIFITTYLTGLVYVIARIIVSIISILKIIQDGVRISEENGYKIIVTKRNIDPFSWMNCIVMSNDDYVSNHTSILIHEKTHVLNRHSIELLMVDIMAALQWFNPGIWMLRSDLQDLHEYEADDAVLKSNTNIKEYQYLLIKKAVGKSGYSVANSFNHSILKKRITMMSKLKSHSVKKLRLLYMLPLVCLCLSMQAQTISKTVDKNNEKNSPLIILRYTWGEEKQISKAEMDNIDPNRIKSIEVLKGSEGKKKYGDKALNGVIIITPKPSQELDTIVVVSYSVEKEKNETLGNPEPEIMPSFQGGGVEGFSKWLFSQIRRPKGCTHKGTMKVSYVVTEDGSIKDVKVRESVCEELDNMVVSIIRNSPKWEPAKNNGKPVAQCLHIPIKFEMR
ncbi:MAG: TonB family protein [Bacteroidales bacterium]|nr:TonB family protein [Bacteroidales bacterium]